jgi:hypothetical protein
MKVGESVTTIVQPAYFIHLDPQLIYLYPDIDDDQVLMVDVEVLQLVSITDLYHDGTTFVKRLDYQKSGNTTASPFNDSHVRILIKLEVDGEVVYDTLTENDES